MPHPEMCILLQGKFPETASRIPEEECFCFVSLDVDLFKPTYEGLKFFYHRLIPGGYIMVHDYNDEILSGVKKAVENFCDEIGAAIIPICDMGGSCVISKPRKGRDV
jgi:O-methyltransferase